MLLRWGGHGGGWTWRCQHICFHRKIGQIMDSYATLGKKHKTQQTTKKDKTTKHKNIKTQNTTKHKIQKQHDTTQHKTKHNKTKNKRLRRPWVLKIPKLKYWLISFFFLRIFLKFLISFCYEKQLQHYTQKLRICTHVFWRTYPSPQAWFLKNTVFFVWGHVEKFMFLMLILY